MQGPVKSDTSISLRSGETRKIVPSNPYDPNGWTGKIELIDYGQANLAINTPLKILNDDSQRLWFLIGWDDVTVPVWVWYKAQSGIPGITAGQNQAHVLIHNASFPSLIQGSWWATSPSGGSVIQWIVGRAISSDGV